MFLAETKEELWDSPEEILEFFRKSGNIEKYRKGEYGANLLFKYKTLALTKYMDIVLEIAYNTAIFMIKEVLYRTSYDMATVTEFISQLKRFNQHRTYDFLNTEKTIEDKFDFEFQKLGEGNFSNLLIPGKRHTLHFCHNPQQKKTIAYNFIFSPFSFFGKILNTQ